MPSDRNHQPARHRILLRAFQSPFDNYSAEQSLARRNLGDNVGNLLFSHSAYRLLSAGSATVQVDRFRTVDPGWVNDSFDVVVLPLANAFRQHFILELEDMTATIERLRIPVVVAGVNAQLTLKAREPRGDIGPAVTRFVRAVLRNAPNIGVRGERTAQYLQRLGFGGDDVRVIGCPAMFAYGPDLPQPRLPEAINRDARISLNLSPYVHGLAELALDQGKRYPNLVYTAQDLPTLGLLLTGRYESKLPVREGFPAGLDHPLVSSGRTVVPVNIPGWLDHLAGCDFSFGSRIHGNIAAILAGTPAFVLAHDSRTAELADYHALPHHILGKDVSGIDAAALYEEADYAAMLARHTVTWARFSAFLASHGLRTRYDDGVPPGRFDEEVAAICYRPVATLQPNRRPQVALAQVAYLAERAGSRVRRILASRRRSAATSAGTNAS